VKWFPIRYVVWYPDKILFYSQLWHWIVYIYELGRKFHNQVRKLLWQTNLFYVPTWWSQFKSLSKWWSQFKNLSKVKHKNENCYSMYNTQPTMPRFEPAPAEDPRQLCQYAPAWGQNNFHVVISDFSDLTNWNKHSLILICDRKLRSDMLRLHCKCLIHRLNVVTHSSLGCQIFLDAKHQH
jgi:hypothetical protein